MIYDIKLYRYYMHGISIAFEIMALILAVSLYLYLRRRFRNRDITDENEVAALNETKDDNDGSNSRIYKKPLNWCYPFIKSIRISMLYK